MEWPAHLQLEGGGGVSTGSVEARYYDQKFSPIKFTSRRKHGVPRKAYMDLKSSVGI